MREIKLKPCPFCGSENIYKTHSQEIPLGTKNPEIFCNTCKAIFAVEDDSPYLNCDEDFKYRREKTAEAWNKRAERHAHWVAHRYTGGLYFKCSNCGNGGNGSDMYCPKCGAKMNEEATT